MMLQSYYPNDDSIRSTKTRAQILRDVIQVLATPSECPAELENVLARAGVSDDDITDAFGDVELLFAGLANYEALVLCGPLRGPRLQTISEIRLRLMDFAMVAWLEYSTTLVSFVHMMVAEATKRPSIKKYVYENGPRVVTTSLREFLADAADVEGFHITNPQFAAEHIMGMLRDPLYRGLMLDPQTTVSKTMTHDVATIVDQFLRSSEVATGNFS